MRKSRLGLAALAVSATLALGACGGTTTTVTEPAPAQPGTVTEVPGGTTETPTTSACPADAPLNIGLVVQGQNNVETNNPLNIQSSSALLGYGRLMTEPLAIVNRLDANDITPWLASNVQWNDSMTELQLTARDGVTWSDGTPFTAEDIAYNFELRRDFELDGAFPMDANRIIGDVTTDGNVVTVHYNVPQLTTWPAQLHMPIVQKAYTEQYEGPELMTAAMVDIPTTGPYTVGQFTPQTVTMVARNDWWGGPLAAPTINYVSYNDNTGLETGLASGSVQWSQSPMNNPDAFVNADPAHNVWWTPSDLGIEVMFVNTHVAPWDDVNFRKAASMSINREAFRAVVNNGAGALLTSPTGLGPAGDSFLDPALANETFGDAAAARAILEEAGYTNVGVPGQLTDPAGNPVEIVITAPSDWNDYVDSGMMLAQTWTQELGANATFEGIDVDTWWGDRSTGDFNAAQRAAGTTGPLPFFLYRDMIAQPGMGGFAEMGAAGDWNLGRWVNPEAGQAFTALTSSPVAAEREAGLRALQRLMVEEVPVIPLAPRPIFSAFSTMCYTGWPSDANPYAAAQILDAGAPLMVVSHLENR